MPTQAYAHPHARTHTNRKAISRTTKGKVIQRFLLTLLLCFTRHTAHITHHTSHITHHTSHITHHTSHITHRSVLTDGARACAKYASVHKFPVSHNQQDTKTCQNDVKTMSKRCQNDVKTMSKRCQNDVKTMPKRCNTTT